LTIYSPYVKVSQIGKREMLIYTTACYYYYYVFTRRKGALGG